MVISLYGEFQNSQDYVERLCLKNNNNNNTKTKKKQVTFLFLCLGILSSYISVHHMHVVPVEKRG